MPLLPAGEYKPDISDYQTGSSRNISNVLPRADGYGPFPDLVPFTSALSAACRGAFVARNTDGSVSIFAGTSTKLWRMNNTDFTWTDVSLGSGTYAALTSTDQWQFVQFNNFVLATQANVVVQVYDLTSSTNFANNAGSPPQARYIAVVGRFVVLSGLLSNPYRIQWSGLNATTTWSPGVNQSDFQDLPDGGIVRGVAGGEFGVIMQDASIRRMTYAPGSPVIFQIDRIAQDDGLFAPLSLIRAGDKVFFCSPQGFKVLAPGGAPTPIGKERVDRTFFADVDQGSSQLFIGAADPRSTRVFWCYKSLAGQSGLFDKMLCYDWALDRWAPIAMSGEYLMTLSKPGLTLENMDTISGNLDLLPFSLDNISTSTFPQIAAFSGAHKLGFFTGDGLEATLDSTMDGANGRRLFVSGFTPVTDAPSVYGSLETFATLQADPVQTAETAMNAQGICPQRKDTRFARARMRIPAAQSWTYATGVEPTAVPTGSR